MPDNTTTPRKMGGHELPDHVQDRPEQNEGYDAAVRGRAGDPLWDAAEPRDGEIEANVEDASDDGDEQSQLARIDERAEQDAAGEVRRRERQNR